MKVGNSYFEAKDILAYAAVLALTIGFLWSRSMYSFGLLFMGIYWVVDIKKSLYLWSNTWFLSSIALALLVPISDLVNGHSMSNVFFIKLSLPLYIVFFANLKPKGKFLSLIICSIVIIIGFASLLALINYYNNTELMLENYKVAKVMPIGKYNDHIRISVAIAGSILLALYEYLHCELKWEKYLLMAIAIFQIIFLHILSARTGLIMFYLSGLIYALITIFSLGKKWPYIAIAILSLLPIASFYIFPSFYTRVGYTQYDLDFYKRREYREGSSDGIRYFSILGGLDIYKENKVFGIGFNQLPKASENWLKKNFPLIKETEIIQPSSEYILHLAASGILGICALLLFSITPFFYAVNRQNIYFISVYTSLLCIIIFEIFLENQYGMYVFGFFTALTWVLPNKNNLPTNE